MSITKQEEARYEKCFTDFFRVHPELRMEANKSLIWRWLDSQMLLPTAENLEIAALGLGNRLARRIKETPPLEEPPAAAAPEPIPMEKWSKSQLRRYLAQNTPQTTGSLEERKAARPLLPAEYSRAVLVKLSADELRELAQRYGREKIINRIEGIS